MGYENFGTGDPKLAKEVRDLIAKGDSKKLAKVLLNFDTTERELVLLECDVDLASSVCDEMGFIYKGL